jgi:AraC family transcriptional regulator, arabinose operon regulatory protein
MTKRLLPVITESDRELPYYLIDAGFDWNQEHIISEHGYYYQWIQCVKGEGELVTKGKTFRIKEGNAMLLFKGVPHEYYAISPTWIVDWIVFDGHQVEHFLKNTAGIHTSGAFYLSRPDIFLSRIHSTAEIGQSDSTLKGIKYSGIIYSLLTDVVQYASTSSNNNAYNQYFKLKPLFQYIDDNYYKPLTLEDLANATGVTATHLCTLFKKATNIRIFQYINSVRIQKSKELLLQNPQMHIREVAYLSGFDDANYFCSVFRKQEQMNPSQFRKNHY